MKISGLSYLSIIPNRNNNNILYKIIFEPIFFDNSLTFTQRYEMGRECARLHELSIDISGGGHTYYRVSELWQLFGGNGEMVLIQMTNGGPIMTILGGNGKTVGTNSKDHLRPIMTIFWGKWWKFWKTNVPIKSQCPV